MWINNYDDPPEMSWEEALALLEANGYDFIEHKDGYSLRAPNADMVFFEVGEEDSVIDYVVGWDLCWPTPEEEEQEATREEHETLAFLKIALDEDRLSHRPLFPAGYDGSEIVEETKEHLV